MTVRRTAACAAAAGVLVVLSACGTTPRQVFPGDAAASASTTPSPSYSYTPSTTASPTSSSPYTSPSDTSSSTSSDESSSASPTTTSDENGDENESRMIDIVITGETSQWNGQTQEYETSETFRRRGTLIVEPDPDGGLAVAVFAGNLLPTNAGDVHFVTNTYLYRHTSAARFVWTAQVPVGRVEDGPGGGLVATVDEPRSRIAQLSSFVVRSAGLYTNAKQITEGSVEISELDGSGASGEITLYGTGAIEPGNSFPTNKYEASFTSD